MTCAHRESVFVAFILELIAQSAQVRLCELHRQIDAGAAELWMLQRDRESEAAQWSQRGAAHLRAGRSDGIASGKPQSRRVSQIGCE